MSTNKRTTRYDEEFKRTLVGLYQSGGKLRLLSVKNTEFLRLLLLAGSNNTQPLKPMMAISHSVPFNATLTQHQQ